MTKIEADESTTLITSFSDQSLSLNNKTIKWWMLNIFLPILVVISLYLGFSQYHDKITPLNPNKVSEVDEIFREEYRATYRESCVYYGKKKENWRIVQTSLSQPSQHWSNLPCRHDEESLTLKETFNAPDAILETNFSKLAHPEQNNPILGFGGAFTEASALNYNTLSDKGKRKFLEMLFGKSGLGYSLGRVPINSCDFSIKSYSFDDVDGDFHLKDFDTNVTHDVEVGMIDLIRSATEVFKDSWQSNDGYDGKLRLFGSPWSPPAWMKAPTWEDPPGALHAEKMTYSAQPTCIRDGVEEGSEYAKAWALYFSKFLSAYKSHGIDFFSITVQNEPEFPAPWEACSYTPELEGDFVANHLGPRMQKDHPGVKIAIFDHNKDHVNVWARKILNKTNPASYFVSAVAYHWYAGGMNRLLDGAVGAPNMHRLQQDLRDMGKIKDHITIGSEACHCPSTGYTGGDPQIYWARAERYAHTMLSDLAAGSNGWMEWNILLDSFGGPNHLGNMCDASILAVAKRAKGAPADMPAMPDFETANYPFGIPVGDKQTREELNALGFPANDLDDGIVAQPIYFYAGHVSRYVRPGSRAVMGLVDSYKVIGTKELGALPFRPVGQVVPGGGINNLAMEGIELTMWPCEGSTRQEFKLNKKKQIEVFGHDWLGKPTTSCVAAAPDEWFQGILLTSCESNYGTFDFQRINNADAHSSLEEDRINIVLIEEGGGNSKKQCIVINKLKNQGGAYGPRGGAQITLGKCSSKSAVFSFDESTGEISSSYFSDTNDAHQNIVCMTTGWPFLQMGAFDTPNGESKRTVVILNEANDAANYLLRDSGSVALSGSILPRTIQTVLLD